MGKVAMVTGATRGIGKACALSLARAGYDLVITGRTLKEGDGRATSPFSAEGRQLAVPGSLETTAAEVRALGRQVLSLAMDLLDRVSIDAVFESLTREWGRLDVLVNNAIYQGPGLMFAFRAFTMAQLESSVMGNLVNQAHIARRALDLMVPRRSGVIVSLSSNAAVKPPPAPPDKGGWGFVYGGAKSGFHRIAEFIHVEHQQDGILAFNVEPGFTVTEATVAMFGSKAAEEFGRHATQPATTGDVVAWLATAPEAGKWAGSLISSPGFFQREGIRFP